MEGVFSPICNVLLQMYFSISRGKGRSKCQNGHPLGLHFSSLNLPFLQPSFCTTSTKLPLSLIRLICTNIHPFLAAFSGGGLHVGQLPAAPHFQHLKMTIRPDTQVSPAKGQNIKCPIVGLAVDSQVG